MFFLRSLLCAATQFVGNENLDSIWSVMPVFSLVRMILAWKPVMFWFEVQVQTVVVASSLSVLCTVCPSKNIVGVCSEQNAKPYPSSSIYNWLQCNLS